MSGCGAAQNSSGLRRKVRLLALDHGNCMYVLVLYIWLTEKTRTILFFKMCSELMAKWRNGLHASFSGQHHLWHTENSGSQSLNAQFFELPTCLHSFPCACHFEDKAGGVKVRLKFLAEKGDSSSSVNFYDSANRTGAAYVDHFPRPSQ